LFILDFFLIVKSRLFTNQALRGVHFDVDTNRLYVSSWTHSVLNIYDVQNETELNLINTISGPQVHELKIYMNKIYLGSTVGNIRILDKTNNSLINTLNVCGSTIVIDSINIDWCHGALMHTCRQQNRFQYIYRDNTTRFISLSSNPRVIFFDYRRRLWINEGTTLRIYN
jgi:hypothetical protein